MQFITESKPVIEILQNIHQNNPTSRALLIPGTEKFFEVDLDSRKIDVPKEIVTIETDHNAETVYFKVNRYFDNMDLSQTVCVVEYISANKKSCIYAVPYYDIETFSSYDNSEYIDEPKMIFPWLISGAATEKSGTLQFSLRFFKLDENHNKVIYNLETAPASLIIKKSLPIDKDSIVTEATLEARVDGWEDLMAQMHAVANTGGKLFWKVL